MDGYMDVCISKTILDHAKSLHGHSLDTYIANSISPICHLTNTPLPHTPFMRDLYRFQLLLSPAVIYMI